ncbi:DMT family transporter [Bacillus weihaiensis]|uniref:DMT family transporter n=1 Tax=Bacillus weihaiensis TaxID=1547283 RepID=UPI0023544871|nr:DMT family transporter [Bacillus weihaiensis]
MKRLFADGSLLFVAFIWGATFVVVQQAIAFVPPLLFNSIRFLLAILLLLPFVKRSSLHTKPSNTLLFSGILLGFFLFIGYAFQTVGLLFTTSSKAGFITGLSVIIVPLLSIFILKDKPRSIVFLSAIIGAIGLYLLSVSDLNGLNFGDLLVLICAIGFALHIIYTGKYAKNFNPLFLTITQLLTVSILSLISSLIIEDYSQITYHDFIQHDVILALLITSFLATAVAFFIQTKYQRVTSAARVALIFAMEPVFAAITAYLILGEKLTEKGIIGCLFIFTAMLVAELPGIPFKKSKRSLYEKA